MVRVLFAVLLWLLAAPAHAAIVHGDVTIDPQNQIRPALLERAITVWTQTPQARRDVLAVADFSQPSPAPRFFIVDMSSGQVEALQTSHGKGSDSGDGMRAVKFSNEMQADATSLGTYLTGERFNSEHGTSLYLEGLDPSNSNTLARLVVIHAASYMTPQFIAKVGRPGRSEGCFAFDPHKIDHVVSRLRNGALIYAGD